MNGLVELNMDIIFESALVRCRKIAQILFTPLEDINHQSLRIFDKINTMSVKNSCRNNKKVHLI